MLPVNWDPGRDLMNLQRELDEMFHKLFGTTRERGTALAAISAPSINTYVKDNVFHLEAELPGVDTNKLDVRIDGRDLILRGERRETHKAEEADYLIRESRISSFERRLTLPNGADVDKVHATFKDGLLEVSMPITAPAIGGRKIAVECIDTGKKSKEVH